MIVLISPLILGSFAGLRSDIEREIRRRRPQQRREYSLPLGAGVGAAIRGSFAAQVCLIVAALVLAIQAVIILGSRVPKIVEQPVPDPA